MDPMTDQRDDQASKVAEFYDGLSVDYDEMTGFSKRFMKERPYFHVLIEKHKIKTALDAGSGTGFHSLLLAQLGVDVTAVDISAEMLQRVRQHANSMGLRIQTVRSSFEQLDRIVKQRFDALCCLGNSLSHLISDEQLLAALTSFHSVLNPAGLLFLQNLNYDRILKQRQRVQSVKEAGSKIFVRFYDFLEDGLWFNVLSLAREKNGIRHAIRTIRLRPLHHADMEKFLSEAGFVDVKLFGDVAMNDFVQDSSPDLVILARPKE